MPVLEMMLQPGEVIVSEAGELSWMSSTIEMRTHTQAGGGGGMFGALKRVSGGSTLFMTEFRAAGGIPSRSEEHTSELQSRVDLVCRLLLEKKKEKNQQTLRTQTSMSS